MHLQQLTEVEPELVVCDLHPGYLSTEFAENYAAKKDIQLLQVQHHWAHTASVLGEFDYPEKVIGIVADGTGYGTDGAVWGCECMIASTEEFERIGHLRYFDLPGGDAGAKEAVRPLLGLLKGIDEDYFAKYSKIIASVGADPMMVKMIVSQLDKRLNVVQTSSAGRLFDAAAAVCGLGGVNHFQAQLPMALEALAAKTDDSYSVEVAKENGTMLIDWRMMFAEMLGDARSGAGADMVSAKFHNWFAGSMLRWAEVAREKHNINTVALSGGVFCNRYLSNRVIRMLKIDGFRVLFKKDVPANDGGISLGQAVIGANKLM
jgi:hydrogenase maturation protein HypF